MQGVRSSDRSRRSLGNNRNTNNNGRFHKNHTVRQSAPHTRCRSHSPLKVDCASRTSLNSTGDSGHGSSPGSSGGSIPTRSRVLTQHAHRTTVAQEPVRSRETVVPSFAQYPRTVSELEQRLGASNSLAPANIPMLVVQGYNPPKDWSSRDEVPVTKGMVVNAMFKTYDWVCVRTPLERTGFVPFVCVQALGLKKKTKDFTQQFPEKSTLRVTNRMSPFKKSYSLNKNHTPFQVDKGTQSDSEVLTVKRVIKDVNKTVVRGHHSKPSHTTDLNNNRHIPAQQQKAFTQPLPNKALKPKDFLPQQQTLPAAAPHRHITETKPSSHGPGAALPAPPREAEVPDSPSSVERRRRKAREMYFAHDLSSIGFMLPHARTPVKSPVLNLSFSSDVSDASSVFTKSEGPRLTVLFDYRAQDENDVSVRQNDVVALLNDEDEDWLWVRTDGGAEGFIPRIYAVNLEALNLDPRAKTTYL